MRWLNRPSSRKSIPLAIKADISVSSFAIPLTAAAPSEDFAEQAAVVPQHHAGNNHQEMIGENLAVRYIPAEKIFSHSIDTPHAYTHKNENVAQLDHPRFLHS